MTDREALQRLHDRVSVYVAQHVKPAKQGPMLAALAEARDFLLSERAKQAEPVAWLYRLTSGRVEIITQRLDHYYPAPGGGYVKGEPLYAAPPAVQAEPVAWWIDPPYLDGNHITTDPYEPVRLAARSDVTVRPLVFGNAAPPADDDGKMRRELQHYKNCLGVAADQINEAVRLLTMIRPYVYGLDNIKAIDAYLAKVGK